MPNLTEITNYLDELLPSNIYQDRSLNGLQLESSKKEIKTVAVSVDSGLSVVKRAVDGGADLLIVHHGLFWGEPLAITGAHGEKVHLMLNSGCSLYCSHLPLDGSLSVGNAAEIARFLGMSSIKPWCEHSGGPVGAIADTTLQLSEIQERLKAIPGTSPQLLLNFGADRISRVGIVTGGGSFAISICAESKVDLLITGEPKQEAYHKAKELKQNVLFAGHYATETFGVRALAKKLEEKYSIKTIFIDEPTGI